MSLTIIPLELAEANTVVAAWHRHHKPIKFHRFSIGVMSDDGQVHGAAIVGPPVARGNRKAGESRRDILEVSRLTTDGTKNACSMLYAAAARVGRNMGYERIQTYILTEEPGISLRAAGWEFEAFTRGGQWQHTDGELRRKDQPTGIKERWALCLNSPVPQQLTFPEPSESEVLINQGAIF